MKAAEVIDDLRRRFPNEPEYLQAVEGPRLRMSTTSILSLSVIT